HRSDAARSLSTLSRWSLSHSWRTGSHTSTPFNSRSIYRFRKSRHDLYNELTLYARFWTIQLYQQPVVNQCDHRFAFITERHAAEGSKLLDQLSDVLSRGVVVLVHI